MDMTPYRLPDGTVVKVDSSAAKGASAIDFTLADGSIVPAAKVERVAVRYTVTLSAAVAVDYDDGQPRLTAREVEQTILRCLRRADFDADCEVIDQEDVMEDA